MFTWLKDLLNRTSMSYQQKQMENYLAKSSDLVDLERRQRELTHGRFNL
jgi:hypothetical protein